MTTCGPVEVLVGGTLTDQNIVNPNITGGMTHGQTLDDATLIGNVNWDNAVLEKLANLIKPLLGVPQLSDCQGASVPPYGKVATCHDLTETVAEATAPDKIAGVFKREDGSKFPSGATLLTAQEIADAINRALDAAASPERIAGVFDRTDGTKFSPGAQLMTAQEVAAAIGLAVTEALCGQRNADHWYKPTTLAWDPQTQILTLAELDQDGTPVVKTAQITGFSPALEPVTVPGAAGGADEYLPLAMHGSRSSVLGTPTKYLRTTIQGQAGWIPFYAL